MPFVDRAHRVVIAATFLAVLVGVSIGVAAGAEPRALLLLDPIDAAQTRAVVEELAALGGRVEHVVPGRAIIGRFDGASLAAAATRASVRGVRVEGETLPLRSDADPLLRGIAAAWEQMTMPLEAGVEDVRVGPALAGDAAHAAFERETPPRSLAAPPGADFFDTSEFLLGSMTLAVLFPESNGAIDPNQENWTAAEESDVVAEVMNGMAWWIARAAAIGHTLTIVYDFRFAIAQGYEPITRHSNDHPLWAAAVMTALGYTAYGNQFNNVRDLLNDERDTFGTDWAVATFVIDDTVDPDDNFAGGYFAFSYYGGPYYWMTYGNAGWGIANMDMIAAHELGHSFYAFDEYASSGCTCLQSMGYLNARNQNCDVGCATNNPLCIMRSSTAPISANVLELYSARQVGLLDGDGDGIPNILDEFPGTQLDPFGADTTSDDTPAYSGSAAATAKPNLNPAGQRHDITLNVVSLVEWRVDGGAWAPATPVDGAFDDSLELFTFTAGPLAAGPHIVEARGVHSFGNADTLPAADTLFVAGGPVSVPAAAGRAPLLSASPSPFADRVVLRFATAGAEKARLAVFSSDGRRLVDLADGTFAAGEHEIVWDGRLPGGARAAAGVYFFHLDAAGGSATARAVIMR